MYYHAYKKWMSCDSQTSESFLC